MNVSAQVTSYGSSGFFSRERNITWIPSNGMSRAVPSRGELSISRLRSETVRRVSSFNSVSRLQGNNCGVLIVVIAVRSTEIVVSPN